MGSSSKQIKLGAIMSYLAIAVNILAGLLYTPWMVRTIGQNNYGLYTLATSLISIFLLDFGMSASVSRFVSKYNAEGNQESVNNLLGIVYKLYLIIAAILLTMLIVTFFLIDKIYAGLTPGEIERFKVVYIIAATFSVISFPFTTLNGILTSYEKFIYLKLCDLLNKVLTVVLMICSLMSGFGLYTLVMVNAISGLIIILIKLIFIKQKLPVKVNFKFKSRKVIKDIFSFSVWSTIISLAETFIFNIIPSILGLMSGSRSIALFGIASTLEGYTFTFANAINGMFLPKVSRLVAKGSGNKDILLLMIRVGRFQYCVLGLFTIGFIILGKEFIVLWMGETYLISYYCAITLILPSLFYFPQQIADTTIFAMNKVKIQSFIFVGMAVINILFALPLSKLWGAFGASLSIFLAYFFRTIAMNVVYYKVLKIDIVKFFKECYLKMSLPIILTLTLGFWVEHLFPTDRWVSLILKGIIIVTTYFTLMWFMSFNPYEKDLFVDTFKKIMRKTALKGKS